MGDILKVKQNGQWIPIPSIVGPQGATGATGATGADGQDGAPGPGVAAGGTTGQVLKKKSGTDYDTEWANESGAVTDVQVNGSSVVSSGVANIPMATDSVLGVIKAGNGVFINTSNGLLNIKAATSSQIKSGAHVYPPIVPSVQHESSFYGLSKVAGVDLANETVTVGTYPDSSKAAIQKMLGITDIIGNEENSLTASKAYSVGEALTANGKLYRVTVAIAQDGAIVVEGAGQNVEEISVAEDFVKKTDYATSSTSGVVSIPTSGGLEVSSGELRVSYAASTEIKAGSNNRKAVTPGFQHQSVFYGLAKAAGDSTQASSANAVGTYTAEAKFAIQSMLGVPGDVQVNGTSVVQNGVANIPVASASTLGVVKDGGVFGYYGITINNDGRVEVTKAEDTNIKLGNNAYRPIVSSNQHTSVFYGLAKAAGDTTQSASSNAVGTYTPEAKAAIHTMLGIDPAAIAALVEIPLVETISGTDPVITGQANYRYECGECYTLSITPPATGTIDVLFTSGSTATVLNLASGVVMPDWFDPNSLDTDTVYEILITNGTYGSVMTWPVPVV